MAQSCNLGQFVVSKHSSISTHRPRKPQTENDITTAFLQKKKTKKLQDSYLEIHNDPCIFSCAPSEGTCPSPNIRFLLIFKIHNNKRISEILEKYIPNKILGGLIQFELKGNINENENPRRSSPEGKGILVKCRRFGTETAYPKFGFSCYLLF